MATSQQPGFINLRCMAYIALGLICLVSLRLSMVLPNTPLHWSPTPDSLNAAGFAPTDTSAQELLVPLRKKIEELEATILGLQISDGRDLHAHEERLQQLEQRLGVSKGFLQGGGTDSAQLVSSDVLGRIAALEDFAKLPHPGSRVRCPTGLGNFVSDATMAAAGWTRALTQSKHFGGRFTGWTDGDGVGVVSLKVNVSGQLKLKVGNPHVAQTPTNEVYIAVNNEVVVKLGRKEERKVCLRLEAGDVVKLSESYGQIELISAEMICSGQDSSATAKKSGLDIAKPVKPGEVTQCGRQQKVRIPGRLCNADWMTGKVLKVLNESRAIVQMDQSEHKETLPQHLRQGSDEPQDASQMSSSQYKIYSALDVSTVPADGSSSSSKHCDNFQFARYPNVGIIVVADPGYREMYKNQLQTHRCYAAWRGYSYAVIDGESYPKCDRFTEFFFKKHCIVAEYLAQQPAGFVAAVLDADVVASVLERGLEQWFDVGADIHFYERVWCFEIAAGNYLVKATTWARNFLMRWAEFMYFQPNGFSSSDNGAVHLHLIQTLELEGTERCRDMYTQIHSYNSSFLDDYFKFVNCTKAVLGPPRLWNTSDGGTIAFWGKLHFFVADGVYLATESSDFFGPVFHHGIKDPEVVIKDYFSNLERCEMRPRAHKNHEDYSKHIVHQAKWLSGHLDRWPYKVSFPKGPATKDCNASDPFNQCLKACVSDLSCPLLRNNEEPKPRRTCKECQMLS